MKIDEVCNAVTEKYRKLKIESSDSEYEPNIAIYMSYDYWQKCVSEINGATPTLQFEFYDNNTIMGFPVWSVHAKHDRNGEKRHTPFIVVNLDN